MDELETIYLVWDVFNCTYVGAVKATSPEAALRVVKFRNDIWADAEEMGYEVVTSFLLG